ncbi:hypothetical protein JEM57_22530 [Escherichia albertii]|uniref:hypothetical protein n=1 Tax=Escherichia albertii TaxID=208962 RepID=UPI001375050F|nr:hypothetical protein [Escherichia albertii]MCE7723377.1 hypothetical protein [Escherichia albertii]MCE7727729.1 hypothetical protein [Escherichia albertii]MCU7292056.1 hypothetical protein [Escherichia albertii]QTA14655.1 hypothetical protein FYK19_01450 [Escherichia albertii]HAX3035068.1 hypothetical protein [Escherichia albertii]
MEEQANKILIELLQKASNGIDTAVSFSQAQIPDVVHQLLLWNMVDSLIKTLIAILTIPLVFRFMKKQYQKVEIGIFDNEGWLWEKGKPKYKPTMIWESNGEISFLILPLAAVFVLWVSFIIAVVTNMTWLKIWLAPKLYLIEYAASLVK